MSAEETNGTVAMESSEFEAKLNEFFTQHKESKMKLVPRIVEEFKGKESIVLEHLHNKYVLKIVAEKPKKSAHKAEAAHSETSHPAAPSAEAKPNPIAIGSKKKLIIIIAVVVVVAGLGVLGFLMKDKFLGKHEEPAKTEAGAGETKAEAEQPKQETAPAAETKKDSASPAAPDTAKAASDSAKTE